MPSSSVLRGLLLASAVASGVAPGPAPAQLLPTNPTTTTTTSTVPTTAAPTTVAVTTTAPATTSTASTTTLAPTTTKPANDRESGTTTVVSTTTTPSTARLQPGAGPTPDTSGIGQEGPPPSLPPLARGGGTRVNWAAVVSVTGFAIAFAMLALPGIIQRLERRGPTTTARTRR